MVIVEAAQNPIILNEFALFEKLNIKKDEIKATVRKIIDGGVKIKNKDDEDEVKEFIDKNEKSFKEIYKALDVDLSKYSTSKEGRKLLISLAIFVLSSIVIIFAPAAIIFGAVVIPIEFIILLTEVLSFVYSVVKSISIYSKSSSINEAFDALNSEYKDKNYLLNEFLYLCNFQYKIRSKVILKNLMYLSLIMIDLQKNTTLLWKRLIVI